MSDVSHGKLSRRKMMAAALAAPVLSSPAPGIFSDATAPYVTDPLIAKAEAWVAASARLEAMEVEADDFEGQVFEKAAALRIKRAKACRSRMPEARAVRALKRRIAAGYHDLEQLAGAARLMSPVSIEGALAKIELGLNVQGPFDWRDHALELAQEGIAELRQLAGAKGVALRRMSVVRERMEQPS
jgi:hypothetical protein